MAARRGRLAAAFVGVLAAGGAAAQEGPVADALAAAPALPENIQAAATVRSAVAQILARAPQFPGDVAAALTGAGSDGTAGWMATALLFTVVTLAAALAARFGVRRWTASSGPSRPEALAGTAPDPRARRFGRAMARVVGDWVATAAYFVAGIAVLVLIAPEEGPARWTAFVVLAALGLYLVLRGLAVPLFAAREGEEALFPVPPGEARAMLRQFLLIAAVGSAMLGLTNWLAGLQIDPRSHALVRIVTVAFICAAFAVYFVAHRKPVARAIRGEAAAPSLVRQVLAGGWHLIAIVYLVVAGGLQIGAVATGQGPSIGPILGPIVAFVAGFFTYGVALVVLDRQLRVQRARIDGARPAEEAAVPPAQEVPAEAATAAPAPSPVEEPVIMWRRRWTAFASDVAFVGAVIVAIGVLGALWGFVSFDEGAPKWFGIVVVLFISYVLYQALRTWIDGKIAEEEGPAHGGDPDEGMGPGASRLATLLPLARNVLSVAILAVAGMIVLAGLGVNVAPLFAGAGVVGLAIGFGAQTLIRDIFSGAFFLADDAFRRGEYIDVGGTTGAVEKISLRSFQLRHHNGPLHTIPFGEIKQLTNFSRDWVVMKLPLRIAYGTDVERVRKLVKKLGQEMLQDPEIGPLFLQPLKSQGVVEMEDSAMIMRVKFMTRPGDQFLLRRHVYTRIGELFEREGIRFAHRQVTVRIADEGAHDEETRQAAAGAAARAVVDQAAGAR